MHSIVIIDKNIILYTCKLFREHILNVLTSKDGNTMIFVSGWSRKTISPFIMTLLGYNLHTIDFIQYK